MTQNDVRKKTQGNGAIVKKTQTRISLRLDRTASRRWGEGYG